ncbi:MAG TPA: hypothetical protein VGC74_08000 [Stenotrophomonas sp.]|jgi:hypothetical protein
MKIRSAIPLSVCLLVVACVNHEPSKVTTTSATVMCSSSAPAAGTTSVRVVVFADGTTKPVLCTVRSGMEVVWETQPGTLSPFLLRFKQPPGTAAAGWAPGEPGRFLIDDPQKQFPSRADGDRQEVRLQAKAVTAAESIDYCVAMGVTCPDPGIKILPN